jgi:hypothetical protein
LALFTLTPAAGVGLTCICLFIYPAKALADHADVTVVTHVRNRQNNDSCLSFA